MAVDADGQREVPGLAGGDAGERVLEHRRLRRLCAEQLGSAQERVGRRLALEVLAGDRVAVHARVEEVAHARGFEERGVLALEETTAVLSPASRAACTSLREPS